jgi:hypothetical protein
VREAFLNELARGIVFAAPSSYSEESARALAEEVWQKLQEMGTDAFPCMVEVGDDLRFIYQWDENPPVVTVMLWDDVMWRDMARVVVPAELAD